MQRPNGIPACASCKHQRKKCTEKCILAPFFPVENIREFQAVHKVFGVSNVAKSLKILNHEDRKRAADSLIWEASCWQRDPVNGPYGEHIRVFEELKLYKSQYFNQLRTQGTIMYKPAAAAPPPLLIGWKNKQISDGGINSNGGLISSIQHNGNSVIDACSYGCPGIDHVQNEKQWPENDHGSAVILPQHQYYLAGPYNLTDAKTAESSLWEGNSCAAEPLMS